MNANSIDEKQDLKKKKKSWFSLKKILLFLLITVLLSAGGFYLYDLKFAEKPGKIEKSALPEEVLLFTFKIMPPIHAGVVDISDEIILTEKEIDRIKEIIKNFPEQEKIANTEMKIWKKNYSTLTKFLTKHEKEIQNIYVAYRVNQETGQKLIDEKQEELLKSSTEIIAPSKSLTDKIRAIEEAKSFIDKIKEKVL